MRTHQRPWDFTLCPPLILIRVSSGSSLCDILRINMSVPRQHNFASLFAKEVPLEGGIQI